MANRLLIRCLLVVVTFTLGIGAYLLTSSKWADLWKRDSAAQVSINGLISPDSAVYQRPDGFRLLNTPGDGGWYVYANDGYLAYCGSLESRSHRFFSVKVASYFYVWHYTAYPCVGPVKVDVRPQTVVGPNHIEFNSINNDRIRVTW